MGGVIQEVNALFAQSFVSQRNRVSQASHHLVSHCVSQSGSLSFLQSVISNLVPSFLTKRNLGTRLSHSISESVSRQSVSEFSLFSLSSSVWVSHPIFQ